MSHESHRGSEHIPSPYEPPENASQQEMDDFAWAQEQLQQMIGAGQISDEAFINTMGYDDFDGHGVGIYDPKARNF